MVTFLRPHRHAHGPAAVDVRLQRSHRQLSSSLLPCRCSTLRPMAQDPSHPHRQSKDTAPPQQQPEQEEVPQQPPPPATAPPPPPATEPPPSRDVQEPSTSSSSGSDTWLQLGLGPSPSSPSPPSPRRKRPRTEYEAGPSTSVPPGSPPPPPPQPWLSLFQGSSPSSSSSAVAGAVVAAAPPPPAHEAGTWFVLEAAQNQREPPLPQIPRRYLRVRDGRMTVRVVMSYLVNKLGLEDDSQRHATHKLQRVVGEELRASPMV